MKKIVWKRFLSMPRLHTIVCIREKIPRDPIPVSYIQDDGFQDSVAYADDDPRLQSPYDDERKSNDIGVIRLNSFAPNKFEMDEICRLSSQHKQLEVLATDNYGVHDMRGLLVKKTGYMKILIDTSEIQHSNFHDTLAVLVGYLLRSKAYDVTVDWGEVDIDEVRDKVSFDDEYKIVRQNASEYSFQLLGKRHTIATFIA